MTSAAGFGLANVTDDGTVLDTWFPDPELGAYSPSGTTRLSADEAPDEFAALAGPDPDRGVEVVAVRTVIADLNDKPADTHDAYLRLHLLSHRLVEPHGLNLDGIFGRADQRGVDQLRAVRRRGIRADAAAAARPADR